MSGLNEECGVFGVYDPGGANVARTIYYGLLALQHRGQESCGIAVSDTHGPKGDVRCVKDMGLVSEVFNPDNMGSLAGDIGVGHVRYSTAGKSTRENAQPLVLSYIKGTLALVHNGNLVNAGELHRELERGGCIFQTTIDTEVIAYNIARERITSSSAEEAVARASEKLRGSFSLIVMSPRKLIGVRDRFGFRPLCLGRAGTAYVLASESCALDAVGAEFIRDVEPGEVVTITSDGIYSDKSRCPSPEETRRCVFEYIYFARPDSYIDGVSVYESRIKAGRFLAKDSPVDADIICGIPESGNAAAMGYAMESGIPYGMAFYKNSYVGRSFIAPSQSSRENAVKIKLNVLRGSVAGKRVILVDDSIVRGTTSDRIVTALRENGAKEVHMRISSPPFLWPCYFGTDVPERSQLIACGRSVDEIRSIIGADSLAFLGIGRLREIAGNLPICTGCFSGDYPITVPKGNIHNELEDSCEGDEDER